MMRVVCRWNRWKKCYTHRTGDVRIGDISAWLMEREAGWCNYGKHTGMQELIRREDDVVDGRA